MKPQPTPPVSGYTAWERFDKTFRKIITIPKEAFLKEEARPKAGRGKKCAASESLLLPSS